MARTIAQQISSHVERTTAPFQYAMSTRAGTECIAHVLQALTELDPRATIMSIDGVGAFDLISRKSMLEALMEMESGSQVLPFVRMFYGSHSTYLWEDEAGVVHTVEQGEGGEQGDVLMPLLFSLGQHAALKAVQEGLQEGERLFAFLDDIYVVTSPERVGEVYALLSTHLLRCSSIRINVGKTQVWNAAGERPQACDLLERLSPENRVWRGSELPASEQGIRILGTQLGRPEYVDAQLRATTEKHQTLLQRIPAVPDVQSAWSLLLQCASSRANYLMRVIRPELVKSFAERHNVGLWKCLADILHLSGNWDVTTKEVASMPWTMGGLGLRDGARISPAGFWASWADSLGMIKARHPQVADTITQGLNGEVAAPTLRAAARARHDLTGVQGFEPPSWEALADGVRPPFHDMDDGGARCGATRLAA